jgi:hypothetical protein
MVPCGMALAPRPTLVSENLAATAEWGRRMTWIQYQQPNYLDAVKARGALFRQDIGSYGSFGRGRPSEEVSVGPSIVRGGKTMELTVGPDVSPDDPFIHQLLEVAALPDVKIAMENPPQELPYGGSVQKLTVERNDITRGCVTISEGTRFKTSLVSSEGIGYLADSVVKSVGQTVADRLAVALLAHQQLKRDLFISNQPDMQNLRNTTNILGAEAGIVSSIEAVRIVYTILRRRNKFIVNAGVHVDDSMFYNFVSRAHLPATLRALRSCLEPSNRDCRRAAATTIESILARYDALLVSADEVAQMHLFEGRQGGGPSVLARYLTEIRQSIVLFTGALDALAVAVGQLAGASQSELKATNWWKLFGRKGCFKDLDDPWNKMADAAGAAPHPLPDLAFELRDRHQHRDGISGVSGKFVDEHSNVHATYSLLGLRENAREDVRIPPELRGAFDDCYVQPHILQHVITSTLGDIVESVFRAVEWQDADWFRNYDGHSVHVVSDQEIAACAGQWLW